MLYLILLVGALVSGHIAWVIVALVTFLVSTWVDTPANAPRRRRRVR